MPSLSRTLLFCTTSVISLTREDRTSKARDLLYPAIFPVSLRPSGVDWAIVSVLIGSTRTSASAAPAPRRNDCTRPTQAASSREASAGVGCVLVSEARQTTVSEVIVRRADP